MGDDDVSTGANVNANADAARASSESTRRAAAAATKQLLAARKKSVKNLKSKDSAKKIEAVKYCLEDELFVREPGVLPLVIGFLSKIKVPELVHETLKMFEQLLTAAPTDITDTLANTDAQDVCAPKREIHSEANARFIVEQSVVPESPWKGCEPFLAILNVNSLSPEIKMQAIEVYRKLLQLIAELALRDRSCTKALASIQSIGDPRTALLAMLDAVNVGVQLTALTCLATLFQTLVDHAFLESAEQQKVTARFLKFAAHPERRFHQSMLSIIDSLSQFERGRSFLRASGASEVLKSMLVEISDAAASTSATVVTADDAAIIASNTSIITKCVCRLEFAKEQFESSAAARSVNEAVVIPVVDALVLLLQRDVASAISPPAAAPTVVPTPGAPGQAMNAAAAAAAAATPVPALPFPSTKCIEIISALGRMAQCSDLCKARAKENGVMAALLDCFKILHDDDLHQVADKLLHICTGLPGDNSKFNVDPRVLSTTRVEVPVGDTADASSVSESTGPVATESAAFLAPDAVTSLLEATSAMGNKRILFRLVRWLATVVSSPVNARALGDSSIDVLVKILIETPPADHLLVGFLSRCIGASVEQSSSACESCGSEGREPVAALVAFLRSVETHTSEVHDSDASNNHAPTLTGNESELCKLEWLDEERVGAIFEPLSLTQSHHDVDPFLFVVEALDALVLGFSKWNPQLSDSSGASVGIDFCELVVQRLGTSNSTSNAGGAAKASVAAPSKKKIDIIKSAVVGESVVTVVLEKSVELLKLLPRFAGQLPLVSSGILRLVTELMKLPGGIKAMLHLAKLTSASSAECGNAVQAALEAEKNTEAVPVAARFSQWPLSAGETKHTEFACLMRPFLSVLQAPDSTFDEIEAAISALNVMTSLDTASTTVYFHTLQAGAMTVDVPISLGDVFTNVAANVGTLVLLMAFIDVCRLPDAPSGITQQDAFVTNVKSLVLRFISAGTKLHGAAVAMLESQQEASYVDPVQQSPDDSLSPTQTPKLLASPFASRWAQSVLNMRASVTRFKYSSYSAVLLAAELYESDITLALLAAGASVDAASVDNTTALMLALITGNEVLAVELLERKANVDAMTVDGCDLCVWSCALAAPIGQDVSETITSSYKSHCSSQTMDLFVQLDTIRSSPTLLRRLLTAQVDVNVSNADGNFLLHALVSKLLVRKQVRGRGVCARYHSQRVDDSQFVLESVTTLLEEHGADVNACNVLGQTALHLALLFGHTDVVKCLLQHGANPNIQDAYGYLPLHYACLAFCASGDDPSATAVSIVHELLTIGARFELLAGAHVDERKHKLPHEKNAIAIERILDDGYIDTTVPRAITTQVATSAQLLATRGFQDGLLPWHFACGGCSQVISTLCLDDEMRARFCSNGAARAAILAFLKATFTVDLSVAANKGMTSLHFALKTDVAGYNTDVIDLLLATDVCCAQLNSVHDATTIDSLPPIPEGSRVDVLTANLHAIHCCVSSRSFDSKYHVILPNGSHLENLLREQIQQSELESAAVAPGALVPKYLHLAESAFSPLHYAVQTSDTLSQRLLALPGVSLNPEGSDLPLLALACVARRSAQVVDRLVNQQANMRVHLPLLGAQCDVVANQITTCNLANRKHASALHYAVLYEDVAVVTVLATNEEHTNVNVRRSGDGFTPLHLACEMGHMELVRVLLDHGANLLQMSTLSSSANGVTPLHLLIKSDTSENKNLKALVTTKCLHPEMLLEHLGDPLSHRVVISQDVEQAAKPPIDTESDIDTETPSAENAHTTPHNQDITCMLLAEEEHNLDLYTRVSQLRESKREGHTLSKRLAKDLEKSDDVLRVFFKMFADAPATSMIVQPTAKGDASSLSDAAITSLALTTVTFETVSHRHECYRQKIVRSQWIPPRPPPVARRASNNANTESSAARAASDAVGDSGAKSAAATAVIGGGSNASEERS